MAAEDTFSYLAAQGEKHRRARNWTDAEMKGLLYVWEEFISELKKSKRNAKIYEIMAKRFFELTGEQRHREEIKMKITNMSFQYRKLKCTEGSGTPDWPYYKAIEKILTKTAENGKMNPFINEFQQSSGGPSTSHTEALLSHPENTPMGFLPEYTGSSDEMEMKEEMDGSDSSVSVQSLASSDHPLLAKRPKSSQSHQRMSQKRRKLKVMEAMLQEQKKVSRAVEETCREVRRVMHQQNFLQVQSLQLQERMMNLLEKMIQPPAASQQQQPQTWTQAGGGKEPGQG